MAGNSQRKGAVRKGKKGSQVGSGGRGRGNLEGRGPTPKAEDRSYHKASAKKRAPQPGSKPGQDAGRGGGRRSGPKDASNELVYGRNSVLEALRAGIPVLSVVVVHGVEVDDRIREIIEIATARRLPLLEEPRTELDKITAGGVHQGVALRVPPYDYADLDELFEVAAERIEAPLFVALDGVTDPRNLGAVLRSAGAFGAHGVIVPERRSVGMTASAWKVAAGAGSRVRVARVGNLNRALEEIKSREGFVLGLDSGGDATVRASQLLTGPLCLVIGSEGKGLSRLVGENCDEIAQIPMATATESLNASVAAGISLYEIAQARVARGRA